jgi:hypothetical protein
LQPVKTSITKRTSHSSNRFLIVCACCSFLCRGDVSHRFAMHQRTMCAAGRSVLSVGVAAGRLAKQSTGTSPGSMNAVTEHTNALLLCLFVLASDSCDESRPCSSGHFCSTRGVCLKQFACCSVADCEGNPTTAFRRRPVCAGGHFRCERGECRWTCSGSNSRSGGGRHDNPFRGEQSSAEDSVAKVDAVVAATAKKSFSAYVDDPERREYEEEEQFSPCPYEDRQSHSAAASLTDAASVSRALAHLSRSLVCVALSACATVRCAAGYECEKGHCVHASCSRNTDCGDEGYCASNKFCLPRGFCQLPADCAKDPSFFHPMCVGNYGCTAAGRCTFTCGREKLTLVVKGSDESASSSPAADRHVF